MKLLLLLSVLASACGSPLAPTPASDPVSIAAPFPDLLPVRPVVCADLRTLLLIACADPIVLLAQ